MLNQQDPTVKNQDQYPAYALKSDDGKTKTNILLML